MAHHGLIMASDTLGLSRYLSLGRRIRADRLPEVDADWPERVRLVLADLGPTYVKLGQLASIRPDILPHALVRSLERLQDDVPPFPFSEVRTTLERAWGQPVDQVVAWIDKEPMAAASIGQVHPARLYDGREVVIKVRRPGIREQAEADFDILRAIAQSAENRTTWGKQYGLSDLVEEIVDTMRDELDFSIEAQNTETAKKHARDNGRVRIPEVIWDLSRSDVLVLQSIMGIKISDRAALIEAGRDLPDVAHEYVHALYQQIFLDGFFHADPHPGNVHVDDEGRLIFLDWGLVGTFSHDMRRHSVELVLGMVRGNADEVTEALVSIGSAGDHVNRRALLRDVERLRRRYYETQLKDFQLGQAMSDLFSVAQRHRLRIPPEYMLLAKTAVTADGVVRGIDPDFSLLEMGKPLAGELLWNRLNPQNWLPGAVREAGKIGQSVTALPGEVERALKTLSRGEIRIVLEHKNLDKILGHWEMLINRVAMAFLLGAVILGTALVVHRNHLDQLAGIPIGEYAFFLAVALGIWAAIGAVRRGKL
ncbi:AarF/ABC1/UbiB kinase family protein [Sulfobacillus sp. DSM 109850]|uniref:AarF/ABC1/UbiB kinase family protein n=2 Tax=Sulfobacillus harzensis TaxID=2729629 RepID=A0A7Y0Q488_9FIRM|nr:AarF/ABC1/UbiB kinase family protein [Sulfobacillus harzensis]NMP22984.1 AarF/ABC1/UbiB kinase family protein [Sulfobacillus harzensis]